MTLRSGPPRTNTYTGALRRPAPGPSSSPGTPAARPTTAPSAPAQIQTPQPPATQTSPTQTSPTQGFEPAKPKAMPPTERPLDARGPAAPGSVNALTLRAEQQQKTQPLPPRTAEERLVALVKGTVVEGDGRPAPSAKKLAQLVRDAVGPVSRHMSAEELSRVLGQPQWADAIRGLGPKLVAPGTARGPSFLLAAHLARWMDGIFEGATRADVVHSFKSAHPELADRLAHVDADFLACLQRAYGFLPSWSTKPKEEAAATGADAWLSLPTTKDLYAERLENALGQMEEVPLRMQLTEGVAKRVADKQPFRGHNVVMVQHMLGQANPFLDAMVAAGLEVDKAEYVGVPYQNNPAVGLTLERGHGVTVTVPERGDIDSMWQHVCAAVDRAYARHQENGEPILVVDDGGYASRYIAERYKGEQHLFKVVEQTTRGLTEISQIEDPGFPILNVAGSYGKRFESAQVGDVVVQAIRKVLDEVTKTPARKDVLVVGAGKVGMGVAEAFRGDGARVTLFDPFLPEWRKRELEAEGYTVVTDKQQALDKKFLVVGCSGHRSIDMEDFVKMSSPVFVASSSSKRVEIDTLGLKEQATKDGVLRRILAAKVNEQETWHYWLEDGRIVTAMADGLPVNFNDVNSIAPELIDHTMALMLLGAAEAVTSKGKGLVELDPREQFRLQAEIEGIATARTSADDIAIAVGDTTYYGPAQLWSAIARSAATPPEVLHNIYLAFVDAEPMHPVLLAALSSTHEVSDETVEDVLARGNLAHVSRLLSNEMLTDAQEARVIDFVEKAHQDIAFGASQGDYAWRPVAVEQNAHGEHLYTRCAIPYDAGGYKSRPVGVAQDRDLVLSQLGNVLFAHERCPPGFREHVKRRPYPAFQRVQSSTVQLMRNPAWTTAELDALFPEAASVALSVDMRTNKGHKASYAYDLLEAFRDHPAASHEVRERAGGFMQELRELMRQKGVNLKGRDGWTEGTLGRPTPAYL